jgi:hypothetical protein
VISVDDRDGKPAPLGVLSKEELEGKLRNVKTGQAVHDASPDTAIASLPACP